ncbi:hypothetical protein HY504_02270 [Candidatus Wolfebacteria bacterium]|nr:hypothetical protein [Candidatus Wolfebacteria bacterium]
MSRSARQLPIELAVGLAKAAVLRKDLLYLRAECLRSFLAAARVPLAREKAFEPLLHAAGEDAQPVEVLDARHPRSSITLRLEPVELSAERLWRALRIAEPLVEVSGEFRSILWGLAPRPFSQNHSVFLISVRAFWHFAS